MNAGKGDDNVVVNVKVETVRKASIILGSIVVYFDNIVIKKEAP